MGIALGLESPGSNIVLSGMSTMEQVVENVAAAEHSQPHNLTADELALIGRVRDAYRSLSQISCTGCRYCMPCPNGVDIPRVFNSYNQAMIYNDVVRPRRTYNDRKCSEKRSVPICALSASSVWKNALRNYPYRNCWRKLTNS